MILYLGLGTNLGNREDNLTKAIYELKKTGEINILKISSIYESEPVGYKNQSWFLNAVIEANSALPSFQLLKLIKGIEERLGRRETFRWGPRIIDIDILSYEDTIIQTRRLIIPHPEMHLRKFVLIPLAEIAPFYTHPVKKISVWQMIKQCPNYQLDWYSNFNDFLEKSIEN